MIAIETHRVTRRFGTFTAVDETDITVERGEVVGLLGANGAGKTTLMRMILGLLEPSSGRVLLLGGPPTRESRRRTGYVPQGLGLYRDLTAQENLAFVAGAYGVQPGEAPAASRGLIGSESLGVQRQIAFAAALQHDPDLLILDEPTSGVAPLSRARLWEQIRETADRGAAVLVSTHSMDEARQADHLVLMHRGRVIGRGREADIVGSTTAVAVETEDWHRAFSALDREGYPATLAGTVLRVPGETAEEIRRVLDGAGIEATAATVRATLEEAMVLAERR